MVCWFESVCVCVCVCVWCVCVFWCVRWCTRVCVCVFKGLGWAHTSSQESLQHRPAVRVLEQLADLRKRHEIIAHLPQHRGGHLLAKPVPVRVGVNSPHPLCAVVDVAQSTWTDRLLIECGDAALSCIRNNFSHKTVALARFVHFCTRRIDTRVSTCQTLSVVDGVQFLTKVSNEDSPESHGVCHISHT